MPKIVNHETRKKEIIEAAWEIIQNKGMETVSVRKIAEVMNLSTGSIRYYFPTQHELLRSCIRSAGEKVHQQTLSQIDLSLSLDEVIDQLVAEILPMDGTDQKNMATWYEIITYTKKEPELEDISIRIFHFIRHMQATYLHLLRQGDFLAENLDLEIEIERLHAIVIGLSNHWNVEPHAKTKDIIKRTLQTHFKSICKQ